MSDSTTPTTSASSSRAVATALALVGLVGMFFALLGWLGHVQERYLIWHGYPMVWVAIGLLLAVGAAAADSALGSDADFTQGRVGAGYTAANKLLPWIVVVLTFVGMVAISIVHG